MDMTSPILPLLELSSVNEETGDTNPRFLRYRTSIYPAECGVELVVDDLEIFRLFADNAEGRLRPLLLKLAEAKDCALLSKSSENGQMITNIQTNRNLNMLHTNIPKGNKESLDDLNDFFGDMVKGTGDPGNKKY